MSSRGTEWFVEMFRNEPGRIYFLGSPLVWRGSFSTKRKAEAAIRARLRRKPDLYADLCRVVVGNRGLKAVVSMGTFFPLEKAA